MVNHLTSKTSTVLVRFTMGESVPGYPIAGSGTVIPATLNRSPVQWRGLEHLPAPEIDVDLAARTGTLEEDPTTITLPVNMPQHPALQALARTLSLPRSPYPVSVEVIQILQAGSQFEEYILYHGELVSVTRNPKGKKDQVELSFMPEFKKQLEDEILGRRCDYTCDVPFASPACGVNNGEPLSLFGPSDYYPSGYKKRRNAKIILTFDVDSARKVYFSVDPVAHPSMAVNTIVNQPPGWWVRSFLQKDGLSIPIQEWPHTADPSLGQTYFILNRMPPKDWNGASVLLRLDCPKTRAACSERDNALRFGGLGYFIPAYNPTLEGPND